jgi:pantoate--beta-alanine ligase
MSLIRRAAGDMARQDRSGVVAVTDYVNPLQFGGAEDLGAYPRDLERDVEKAAEAGAHLLYAPSTEDLWPDGPDRRLTTVTVVGVTDRMDGQKRPGHFDGVATIVTKLFNLSGACSAYFGEKDYQQLAVVRRLVADLSLPVDVVGCPTVRETDGLALSSRNAYLSAEERSVAARLYFALLAGKRAVEDDGIDDPAKVEAVMAGALGTESRFILDYTAVADPETLERPARITHETRLLIAARLGRARLIDNVAATPPNPHD